MKKLYVGNLPYSVKKEDLESLFSSSGKVTDVSLPIDRETGNVKGFAFITFSVDADAESAIKNFNGADVGGRNIKVNEAREKTPGVASSRTSYKQTSPSGNTNKLYVTNLSFQLTEEELEDAFIACGEVDSAKIILDKETGRSRGFAFVTMSTPEEAAEALKTLNGKELAGRPITVREAEDKPRKPGSGFNSYR